MKITSWNVNSLRAREEVVLDWLDQNRPDVLCMQETKLVDQEFPIDALGDAGYDVIYCGQRSYNGVAIASRDEPLEAALCMPGEGPDDDKRMIAATVGGVRVVCVYVPNGQSLDSEKYPFKLRWLERLHGFVAAELKRYEQLVLCGDFNIAPIDLDVWDAKARAGNLFVSPPERAAFQKLIDLGLTDAFRALHPTEKVYSWWDYRGGSFDRNKGLRIDHMLVTKAVLERTKAVTMDRKPRAALNPSDHIPVTIELS